MPVDESVLVQRLNRKADGPDLAAVRVAGEEEGETGIRRFLPFARLMVGENVIGALREIFGKHFVRETRRARLAFTGAVFAARQRERRRKKGRFVAKNVNAGSADRVGQFVFAESRLARVERAVVVSVNIINAVRRGDVS